MTARSWIGRLLARTPRRAPQGSRQAPPRFRPALDLLEDRLTPSTLGTTALLEGPAAGSDSAMVTAGGPWSAVSNTPWLHTSSTGTGNGLATLTFDANPGATRSGTLTIAGLPLTVTQAGSTYAAASPVTLATFGLTDPDGVAVDGAGNVFVAHEFVNRIVEWQASTQTVSPFISSGLNSPTGLALDGAGDVFFADSGNNAIKEWNASTHVVSTLVSTGLNDPTGLAVDGAGNVFFTDSRNNALKEWNSSTQTVSTLVSSGLHFPTGVAVDGTGNVFFADTGNSAIKVWNSSTQSVSTFIDAGLESPDGVAVDGSGNVFIADTGNNAIKEWQASTRTVTTLIDSGLSLPVSVAVDAAGNLFIIDNDHLALKELPRAFVPTNAVSEGLAGTDALSPVLPATQSLTGVFAPSSDQGWLTVGPVADGVVHFSFTANPGAPRTAHLSVLGQSIPVTQQGTPLFSNLSAPTVTYGTATTTISGQLGTAAQFPTGSVTITLGGVQQTATLNSTSGFSASFDTQVLAVTSGGYTISLAYAGDSNYTSATGSSTLTVTPAALTITPAAGQSKVYGAAVPALAYVPTGFVNGDGATVLSGALATTATAASPVGSYAFTLGTLIGGSNYTLALPANAPTFAVTPAALTITPAAGQSKVYGAAVPALAYTPSGFVNGDPTSTLTGALTTTATPASPVGSYAISLGTLSAGSNYTVALAANAPTFAVTPAALTVTPVAGQSKVYGATVPALTYTADGLVNGDPLSTITGGLGTAATTASPVGNYAITLGTLSAGSNYTVQLAADPPTLAVTPATLTIAPAAGQSKVYGAAVPAPAYTPSGFVNGDPTSTLTGALATTATASSPVGSYAITLGTLSAGGNYTVALAANAPTFAVTPAALTITANDQTRFQGEANPSFSVRYSGLVLGEGPGVLGGTLSFITPASASSPPGSYAITPAGLTSGNYAITFVSGTLTVVSYGQATSDLQAQVDAAGLAHGMQNSLDSQLQAASASFAAGHTADGASQLGAFISHVRAQRGKHIDAALADAWIAYAQRIIAAVG